MRNKVFNLQFFLPQPCGRSSKASAACGSPAKMGISWVRTGFEPHDSPCTPRGCVFTRGATMVYLTVRVDKSLQCYQPLVSNRRIDRHLPSSSSPSSKAVSVQLQLFAILSQWHLAPEHRPQCSLLLLSPIPAGIPSTWWQVPAAAPGDSGGSQLIR